MRIDGSTFLLTGGAGLVGSHIADLLLAKDAGKVVVVDNFLRGSRSNITKMASDSRVEFIEGDICDRQLMHSLLERVDGLIHMAALRIKHCVEDPRLAIDVMFNGPLHLLLSAKEAGIKRIVTASSSSIYGQADKFPTTELQHPYNDTTFYGAAKLGIEGAMRSYAAGGDFSYATMRFFNVYGPRMDIHGVYTEVLIRWIDRIVAGEAPLIFGDGSDSMDFTYVEDAARACVLALENDDAIGAYNIGTGVSTSLSALCNKLLVAMDSDIKPEYQPASGTNDVQYRCASIAKAEKELNYRPKVSLDEGLTRLVVWWREQIGLGEDAERLALGETA